jgi:hypothetical protein
MGGAGELSLPVRVRGKIIRDRPVCNPDWMQQTLEMQIPAQVTWTTRNSSSCLEHMYILRVGKIKCENDRHVRKKGRGLIALRNSALSSLPA